MARKTGPDRRLAARMGCRMAVLQSLSTPSGHGSSEGLIKHSRLEQIRLTDLHG